MGSEGSIILIIIIIAVAIIVALWLVNFVLRIRKTQKAYREIMEKKRQEALKEQGNEEAETVFGDQKEQN